MLNATVAEVTERIAARSAASRAAYLARIREAGAATPARTSHACANQAHGFAACGAEEKLALRAGKLPNIAIVSAYNDMLSAHQPLERYPRLLKRAVRDAGGVAQFAGGVPAMCDGITQGTIGMELSLFSRDVVAMATAIALAHDMFDGVLLLGVCDKIVPGLLIGALSFGHLPAVFVPAGPMPSGLPNTEKTRIRERYASGELDRDALMDAEAASYHSPGTCTFYGTANTNQLLMEAMGLHVPGASFENPGTPLRDALTREAAYAVVGHTRDSGSHLPLGELVDERVIVNGVVALLASGGSTNHTMHLVAIAAAAGIELRWEDFEELSCVVPLLARIYPNGSADINHFHEAGGVAFLIGQLLGGELLHPDVRTVAGLGLERYSRAAELGADDRVWWRPPSARGSEDVLRGIDQPFTPDGGIRILSGSLGRAVMKVSAVAPERRSITAPACVFESQGEFLRAFEAGELERDLVAVVRNQGPRANGMPELHKLTPALSVLAQHGHRVALLTDGRMSGATGKIVAAIHCTPEACHGGPIGLIEDGDLIHIDAETRALEIEGVDLDQRAAEFERDGDRGDTFGAGRELFAAFRNLVGPADSGASVFSAPLRAEELTR